MQGLEQLSPAGTHATHVSHSLSLLKGGGSVVLCGVEDTDARTVGWTEGRPDAWAGEVAGDEMAAGEGVRRLTATLEKKQAISER